MPDVFDYVKYFMNQNIGANLNSPDEEMKLHQLLVLANLVALAERDIPLFDDKILAVSNNYFYSNST